MSSIPPQRIVALLCLLCSWPASAADPARLAASRACLSCHAPAARIVGPSFKEIADRYRGDAKAPGELARIIRKGGKGHWGQLPMPANPGVSEAEAAALARWVLDRK
ncbi:c-type cytochrome [Chitiniphilus eburneus]|uniref:c-type cytochrome n=1 Tax=Chitiniphilus eburneus TaxID=2571148 RepID=UPI001FE6CAED|nr:c-type cytochrome [Chitiniphilus eburneus]